MSLEKLLVSVQLSKLYICRNIPSLPGVANPDIVGSDGSVVTAFHHIGGQYTLLLLVLVL